MAQAFRTLGFRPSGPAALPWWSLSSCLLTWPVVTVGGGRVAACPYWSQLFPSSPSTRLSCCSTGLWPPASPPTPWPSSALYHHLRLVPWLGGLLLLVEKSFQVTGDPGLVVWEAADSLAWQEGAFTECDVFCDAVSRAVDVLPCGWQSAAVGPLKAVLQRLLGLLRPVPNRSSRCRLPLDKGDILCYQQNPIVIRSSKGVGSVCALIFAYRRSVLVSLVG